MLVASQSVNSWSIILWVNWQAGGRKVTYDVSCGWADRFQCSSECAEESTNRTGGLLECWGLCLYGRQLVVLYIPLIRVTSWLHRGLRVLWLFFLFYILHQVILAVSWHLICELNVCSRSGLGYIIFEISIFWDVTKRWLVVSFRYFGRTYLSRLQGSNSPYFLGLLWPLKMGPMCCPKKIGDQLQFNAA